MVRSASAALVTRRRWLAALSALLLLSGTAVAMTASPAAAATSSTSFAYTGTVREWTVPEGVTSISLVARGGQGGRGGNDATASTAGSYTGVLSGAMTVTPGQVLTIAVGAGGAIGGAGGNAAGGAGGTNPLSGYAGGVGGRSGPAGSSGAGGGGGAATVIGTGGTTLVAAGGGGGGGSGQYAPLTGRVPYDFHVPRSDTSPTPSSGQPGLDVHPYCSTAGSQGCDGGGSGGGGGGQAGGARGAVEFGAAQWTEWFGYGGYPGRAATGELPGLSSVYQYDPANSAHGSVVISWSDGEPSAPTGLVGSARPGQVPLVWVAPTDSGRTPVSDYVVERALASAPTAWVRVEDDVSTAASLVVDGLADGTAYVFRVAAVNSVGTSPWSATSGAVTPSDVPGTPVLTALTPSDGALTVALEPVQTDSALLDLEHRLDDGPWTSSGRTASPLRIAGLVNGATYAVSVRAVSAIGAGAPSAPLEGIPQAPAGAPSITSVTASIGELSVAFEPGATGGQPVLGYDYRLDAGTPVRIGTSSPFSVGDLASGTEYAVSLRAVTAAGEGAWSAASTVVTPAVPSAPTITQVAPGDRSLSVTFAPGATGGLQTLRYERSIDGAAWTALDGLGHGFVLTGLTNGTPYPVRVRAVNEAGDGGPSVAATGTPATVPGAPVLTDDDVSGAGELVVSFDAADDGGSPVTGYQYSTDLGVTWRDRTDGSAGSPVVVSSTSTGEALEPYTTYHVQLRAVNVAGAGPASGAAFGFVSTSPSAPQGVLVTPGSGSLTVTFGAPFNGGSPVTAYEYRTDADSTGTSTGSLGTGFRIAGLADGTAYGVQVRAVNRHGAGPWSVVQSATPASPPGQATVSSVLRGNQTLTVAVTTAGTGGSPLTGWDVSTDGGATWADAGTASSPLSITTVSGSGQPVQNGTSYALAVRARNASGAGPASSSITVAPAGAPHQPQVDVQPRSGALEVDWSVPGDNGSPTTRIEYRLGDGAWRSTGSLGSPFTVGSLMDGTSYGVQVRLVNGIGAGEASETRSATPRRAPDAPTAVTAGSEGSGALVAWTAPEQDGGDAVTSSTASAYTTTSGGSPVASCTTPATSCLITSLVNAQSYYVSVTATNGAGAGTESSPRVLVVPLARPSAPTVQALQSGNGYLRVPFTAGAAGSTPITSYEYRLGSGEWLPAGTMTSPVTISGLTNGTAYSVELRAVSSTGVGAPSAARVGTPFSVPSTPQTSAMTVTPRSTSIDVAWEPVDDNGSPITQYAAVAWNSATLGGQSATCTTAGASSCTITGLGTGSTYYVSLQATNGAGFSLRSDRVAVTLVQAAVSAFSAGGGDGSSVLTWTAGSNGGSTVTDYVLEQSTDGGATWSTLDDGTSTATSYTVTGLTNGTPHLFRVAAVNGNGTGTPRTATVTPSELPRVPTVTAVTVGPGAGALTVAWTAPSTEGGAAITGYRITSSAGGVTTVGAQTSAAVTGLAPHTSHTFTVAAVNSTGVGGASAPSAAATPLAAPGAPTAVAVSSGDRTVTVTWSPPVDDGGSPVTSWVVSGIGGNRTVAGGSTGTLTVTGLTNGTTYTVAVRAVTTIAAGPFSAGVAGTPSTVPGTPALGSVSASNAAATVTWTAPSSNGGSAITGYVVTPSCGKPVTVGLVLSTTVTDLVNGTPCTFRVAAVNLRGAGATSAASAQVVPSTAPAAATAVTAVRGDGAVSLTWAAPGDGGSPLTALTLVRTPGGSTDLATSATGHVVDGLVNGEEYTFALTATNVRGAGATATVTATPATSPGAPTITTATPGYGRIALVWEPPTEDGGAALTGYAVTVDGREPVLLGLVGEHALTGLAGGRTYDVTVRALNAVGAGSAAIARVTVPLPPPVVDPVVPVPPVVDPVAPVPAEGAAASGSATSDAPDGTATTSVGTVEAVATGRGSFTLSQHAEAPPTRASGAGEGGYYRLHVAEGSGFGTITLRLDGGRASSVLWFDGTAWHKLAGTTRDPVTGQLTVVLDGTTTPAIGDLGVLELAAGTTEVVRHAGADRGATALAVSRASFPVAGSAATVVLAREDGYADALTGAPLAAAEGGPLLLTPSHALPPRVARELRRLLPAGGVVHLLGGTAALSPEVEAAVAALGLRVVRLGGADRYATAVEIASALGDPNTVLVASGTDFPDAMSAAPAAVHRGGAVLLSRGDQPSTSTRDYLAGRDVRLYAVGSQASASDRSAISLAGRDRYATAVRVAEHFFPTPASIGVAVGDGFADALVGGAPLGRAGAPLLLLPRATDLPPVVERYLTPRSSGLASVSVFGGTAALSEERVTQVVRALP